MIGVMHSRTFFRSCAVAAMLVATAFTLRTAAQRAPAWDERYRALPEAAAIGQYMQRLSARPHFVGSPYNKDNAE